MHETDALALLDEMATKRVMVEICLTSNDLILGIRGRDHPLTMYLRHGVPVALATDDEGVSRSEMTAEYLRAAEDQQLGYQDLKAMARTSLEYAFIPGASLWRDARRFLPANECSSGSLGQMTPIIGLSGVSRLEREGEAAVGSGEAVRRVREAILKKLPQRAFTMKVMKAMKTKCFFISDLHVLHVLHGELL